MVEQGGILFPTNQGICLRFCSRPIRMRNWLLLPVKAQILQQNIGS